MNTSTQDQIEGKFHEVKGKVKETAGRVANNPDLETEGQDEKLGGKVQKKVGQVEKVQTIREDELAFPEIAAAEGSGSYVKGVSPDKVIVLNPAALRSHPVIRNSH